MLSRHWEISGGRHSFMCAAVGLQMSLDESGAYGLVWNKTLH